MPEKRINTFSSVETEKSNPVGTTISQDVLLIKGIDALREILKSAKSQFSSKSSDTGNESCKRILRFVKPAEGDSSGSEISSTGKRQGKDTECSELNASELRIVSTTAATLSHEINNPLMTIFANAEMVLSRGYGLDNDIIEKIRIIASMADRIRKVTSKLMNLEHLEYNNTTNGKFINLEFQETEEPVNNTALPPENRLKNISLDKPERDHILVKRS